MTVMHLKKVGMDQNLKNVHLNVISMFCCIYQINKAFHLTCVYSLNSTSTFLELGFNKSLCNHVRRN